MLLRTYWHHEEGVVGKADEGEEHESKKDIQICSFRQAHVAQRHEECSQGKEDECHWIKTAPERHEGNHQGPEAKNTVHAIHLYTPFSQCR